jgi:hypothetical protein
MGPFVVIAAAEMVGPRGNPREFWETALYWILKRLMTLVFVSRSFICDSPEFTQLGSISRS